MYVKMFTRDFCLRMVNLTTVNRSGVGIVVNHFPCDLEVEEKESTVLRRGTDLTLQSGCLHFSSNRKLPRELTRDGWRTFVRICCCRPILGWRANGHLDGSAINHFDVVWTQATQMKRETGMSTLWHETHNSLNIIFLSELGACEGVAACSFRDKTNDSFLAVHQRRWHTEATG